MRIAIKFAYDGTKFFGSQRQPNVKTVEGEIIDCILKFKIINDIKESKFQVASRTDSGVSALGNVLAFNTDFEEMSILNILNSNLTDCWFYGTARVVKKFNPRHANLREYRYHINNNSTNLDITSLKSIVKLFVGAHDFRNFSKPSLDKTERTIKTIKVIENDGWIFLDFKAKSFLWNQIRRIVNSLLKYASGELAKDDIENALNNPNLKNDFGLAPAEPLFLMDIEYDVNFIIDKIILKKMLERLMNKFYEIKLKQGFFNYLIDKF